MLDGSGTIGTKFVVTELVPVPIKEPSEKAMTEKSSPGLNQAEMG